jgi:hypothetical protein
MIEYKWIRILSTRLERSSSVFCSSRIYTNPYWSYMIYFKCSIKYPGSYLQYSGFRAPPIYSAVQEPTQIWICFILCYSIYYTCYKRIQILSILLESSSSVVCSSRTYMVQSEYDSMSSMRIWIRSIQLENSSSSSTYTIQIWFSKSESGSCPPC